MNRLNETNHLVETHMGILKEMNRLYAQKNKDYGDAFHTTFLEEGFAMARIRLTDKLSRFKTLSRQESQEVKDESLRDTLLDLANYAVMTVMELDGKKPASTPSPNEGIGIREGNVEADSPSKDVEGKPDDTDQDPDPKDITPLSIVDTTPRKERKQKSVNDELYRPSIDPRTVKSRFA